MGGQGTLTIYDADKADKLLEKYNKENDKQYWMSDVLGKGLFYERYICKKRIYTFYCGHNISYYCTETDSAILEIIDDAEMDEWRLWY